MIHKLLNKASPYDFTNRIHLLPRHLIIARYARFDPISGTYTLSAFLIAQIGKNYTVDHGNRLTGSSLMNYALDILSDIQHRIGGGVVYLDAENRSALISFYENTVNFKFFGERYSENDKTKYLQFMRFL